MRFLCLIGILKCLNLLTPFPYGTGLKLLQKLAFAVQNEVQVSQIKFYFFYSKDCEDCNTIKEKTFSPLEQKYNLDIKSFELDESGNYELLSKLEEKYNDRDNEIPVVIIGEHILGGKKEIQENLEKFIQKYKQNGCDFPSIDKVYLAYFYEKKCKECNRVTYELKYLANKYPNLITKSFDIGIAENTKLNEILCELYKVPQKKRLVAPMVFIGEEF